MPPAKPDAQPNLKALLFQKISDTFPNKAVSIVDYELGHSKLANRNITVPQIGIKVQFTTAKGNFAIAGMIPENADGAAIEQLIGRMKADALKHEAILTPSVAL